MANNPATKKHWQWVVVEPPKDGGDWYRIRGSRSSDDKEPPLDLDVRIGTAGTRLIVTGLRIGARDNAQPYEISGLRSIVIGEILARIREARDHAGKDFHGDIRLTDLTVHRGPTRDTDKDQRILETYEAMRRDGLSKTKAADATAKAFVYADRSHVYKRLARARKAPKEDATDTPGLKKRKQGGTPE